MGSAGRECEAEDVPRLRVSSARECIRAIEDEVYPVHRYTVTDYRPVHSVAVVARPGKAHEGQEKRHNDIRTVNVQP